MRDWVFVLFFILVAVLAIAGMSYTVDKCGWGKSMLLGKNGFWYAAAGYCD